jgi:hypothetical protein
LNLVRDLVRRSLLSAHHRWIVWHPEKHVAYFRLRDAPEEWSSVVYRWTSGAGRSVVAPREAKTRDGYTGYRHDAAELAVRRLDGRWYVQVRPSYLFTWDGRKVSGHHDDALSVIKRMETHPAVSQALRMWAHLFVERLTLDGASQDPFALGPLAELSSPRSVIDQTWRRVSAKDLGYPDDDGLTLFDPDDVTA